MTASFSSPLSIIPLGHMTTNDQMFSSFKNDIIYKLIYCEEGGEGGSSEFQIETKLNVQHAHTAHTLTQPACISDSAAQLKYQQSIKENEHIKNICIFIFKVHSTHTYIVNIFEKLQERLRKDFLKLLIFYDDEKIGRLAMCV